MSVHVGSIASQALCVEFTGWNKSAEGGGVWVHTEEAGGLARLVFDLGELLHVSSVDFLLEASDLTVVKVDISPVDFVDTEVAAGYVRNAQASITSAEWVVEGGRGVSMYLSAGSAGGVGGGFSAVASQHWSIETNFSSEGQELRIRGVQFWYWRTVLDQQVQPFRVHYLGCRVHYLGCRPAGSRVEEGKGCTRNGI